MASREGVAPSDSAPSSRHEDNFAQFPRHEFGGPPSIISSRMTDIASEDGGDLEVQRGPGTMRRGTLASDPQSRPGTARTGMSSRSPWAKGPPLSRGLDKRGSISGSVTGSTSGNRPLSSASRSHVPSLASHAFFRPMSSQKLQAQRGLASRPSTMSRQVMAQESADEDGGPNVQRQSVGSNPAALHTSQTIDETQPPPSRGTEMTEQETYDRITTTTTSPTHGHNPTASVTDSVRPLQKKPADKSLAVDLNRPHATSNLPTPMRTPRSFRSSFLLPTRNEGTSTSPNREMQGGEKLDSAASSPQLPQHAKMETSPKSPVAEGSKPKSGRNWEYFEGNTRFGIGGRLQNTRDRPINIATGVLVVIPGVLFFAGSASWIWSNISPAIPMTLAYIFYICLSSFLHASGSNPGILPRNVHHFPPMDWNEDPLRLAPPTNDWTLVKSSENSTAAMEVPTKYCKTCNIWRPPRAHHCRLCDNCVETQDHHCVWLNNCIGRRNYRYFFTFVSSATFFGMYLIGVSIAQLIVYMHQQGISFGESISHFRVALAIIIYCVIFTLYPAALMGYHLFLMARGETTREYLNSHKFLKKDRYRAFTQGNLFKNWLVVLCRPRPPAYIRFKDTYAAGDQRLGAHRDTRRGGSGRGAKDEAVEMHPVRHQSSPRAGTQFQGPVALRNAQQAQGPTS